MHGDSIRLAIEGREQPANFVLALLAEQVKGPSTVFSAAP
jgi:hypothetical protein